MNIFRIGCNSHHDINFKVNRNFGYDSYLFLFIKTPAIFFLEKGEEHINGDYVILYDKHTPHRYQADHHIYVNDWIHFDHDEPNYFTEIGLPFNQLIPVANAPFLSNLIRMCSTEFYSSNIKKEQTVDMLLKALFIKVSEFSSVEEQKMSVRPYYIEMIALREKIYNNPAHGWKVSDIASELKICNAYFHKIYKDTFGVSCMMDVIESRMEHSKDLLQQGNDKICAIALACGYKNDVHFMRQFKEQTGYSPTEYRKNCKQSIEKMNE
jgi:AraC family transcriptional regulator, arabinose operon regulatory protein